LSITMITRISEHERELTITIPCDVVTKEYNLVLRNYQQKASRPGFRPGKMPEAMVKQFFGAEIMRVLAEKLIDKSFDKACDENKVTPVSQKKTELISELKPHHDFAYKAIFQVKPEIEVKNYKNLDLDLKNYVFSEEDVNEELEHIRENQAIFAEPENRTAISSNDSVECDSDVLIEGVINTDYSFKDYTVPLFANNVPANLREALIGKKVGEKASVSYTMPEDHQDQIIAGKVCEMLLTIKAFKERVLPELNDDFAKDLSDKFNSLEDVKESIRLRLSITANRRRDYFNQSAVVKALVDNNLFEVPSAMIDRATLSLINRQLETLDKKQAEETVAKHWQEMWETFRPRAEFKVKADLILEKLMVILAINPSEEEINYRVQNTKNLEAEDAAWAIGIEKIIEAIKQLGNTTITDEPLFPKGHDHEHA
jgi:trigger factor